MMTAIVIERTPIEYIVSFLLRTPNFLISPFSSKAIFGLTINSKIILSMNTIILNETRELNILLLIDFIMIY